MKKVILTMVALVMAIFISGQAAAANWGVVSKDEEPNGLILITSVDKDSIRRGIESKQFPKFSRKDGFSAIVKTDIKGKDGKNDEVLYLVSFYEENGKRMFILLDDYGTTGDYKRKDSDLFAENVDELEGWQKVWSYIEANMK